MENTRSLQALIDFGIESLSQMKEFLDSPEVINEAKELIANNIVLINSMLQTAIYFKGTLEQENALSEIFSKTLEDNYNFLKKVAGY